MKHLNIYDIEQSDTVAHPNMQADLHLSSPATSLFADFLTAEPRKVLGTVRAVDALKLKNNSSDKVMLVVDNNGALTGLIGSKELNEQVIISEVAKGNDRAEILVSDLMVSKHKLHAFDYKELLKASVDDVLTALKNYGFSYCLVVDHEVHEIRGVISIQDVIQKLNLPNESSNKGSFANMYRMLQAS